MARREKSLAKTGSPIPAILCFGAIFFSWIFCFYDSAAALTLGESVRIALRANLELKQAQENFESRKLARRRSVSEFLPSIGLSARVSDSWAKDYIPELGTYEGSTSRSVSFGLSGSVELFDGFGRLKSLEISRIDLEAEKENLRRARQSIIYETASIFLQAVLDGEILAVSEANLAAQRRSLEHIEAFVEAGKRPIADLYQQKAAVSDAESKLLEAERNFELSKRQLLQQMAADAGTEYELIQPDAEELVASLDSIAEGIGVDHAVRNRSDLLSQRKTRQAARLQISRNRSGYWPSLSLSASVGTSYRDPSGVPGDFADQLDRNLNASIGISASVPIFDRLQTHNAVSQANIDLRRTDIALKSLELRARLEVEQALADLETARKAVEVSRAQFAYAQQALTNYEERYRLGASTLLELLQARAVYVQSSYAVVRSKYDLARKAFALLYAADDIERALPVLR